MMNNRKLKKQAAEKHNAEYIKNQHRPLMQSIKSALLSALVQARSIMAYKSKE